jgi:hypothetical protein
LESHCAEKKFGYGADEIIDKHFGIFIAQMSAVRANQIARWGWPFSEKGTK